MGWYVALIVVLLVPVLLFAATYVWRFNSSSFLGPLREARQRNALRITGTKPDALWLGSRTSERCSTLLLMSVEIMQSYCESADARAYCFHYAKFNR